jgi:hypothetical protein
MTDKRKIVTTGKRSLTIQHGTGAANVIEQVLSDALALARSSEVSIEAFTEINGIMFDQLSVKQLEIWAKTIIIDENDGSEIDLFQLVELMNSTFFELKNDFRFIGAEHWACDGKIIGAAFPYFTKWRKGEFNLSQLPDLIFLWIYGNQLAELDVSNSPKLIELSAFNNELPKLDVSNNSELDSLRVRSSQLTELNLLKNPGLTCLELDNNKLTELDVSNNPKLRIMDVSDNKLTELDVSNNPLLTHLFVYGNQLTELDVSNNPILVHFSASDNQLTELRFSNEMDVENLPDIDIPSNLKFDKVKGCYTNE